MKRLLLLALISLEALFGIDLKQTEGPNDFKTHAQAVKFCQEEPGWRLPTYRELFRLMTQYPKEITHHNRNYWTGTDFYPDRSMAYQLLVPDMDAKPVTKNEKLLVLCVKNTPVHDDLRERFDVQETMIYDKVQNLYWQQTTRQERRNKYTHFEAANYCAALDLEGKEWRLPTVAEWVSVLDFERFDPVLDKDVFLYTYSRYYWTSDGLSDFSNEAYVVGMKVGSIAMSSKVNRSFVRCVAKGK